MDPFSLLREAVKSVKAVRWAVGVAGLVAVVAIVQSFHLAPQYAVFGTLIVAIFMVLLLVFAAATRVPIPEVRLPAIVLIWSFLLISIFSAVLLFTSTFFGWPLPIKKVIFALNAVPAYHQDDVNYTDPPPPSPLPAGTPQNACPSGYFYLQSRATDLYLSLDREGILIQSSVRGSDDQIWTTILAGDYCYLTTKAAVESKRDECLEIKRGHPDDYAGLGPRKTPNAPDQQWIFEQTQPGYYVITSKLTEQAIDVPWGDAARKRLGFFFAHMSNNQQWKLIPVQH